MHKLEHGSLTHNPHSNLSLHPKVMNDLYLDKKQMVYKMLQKSSVYRNNSIQKLNIMESPNLILPQSKFPLRNYH